MPSTYVNIPMPFSGTDEEAVANLASHDFGHEDRCYGCDCRPWGLVALYPCGTNPDRVTVTTDDAEKAYNRASHVARLLLLSEIGERL
jgi:hypothetical protein